MPSNESRCSRRSRRTSPTGPDVERGERLVEQQHARVGGQRPSQRDPLGLPAGQVAGPVRERDSDSPTRASHSRSAATCVGLRHRPGPQPERDVLERR